MGTHPFQQKHNGITNTKNTVELRTSFFKSFKYENRRINQNIIKKITKINVYDFGSFFINENILQMSISKTQYVSDHGGRCDTEK